MYGNTAIGMSYVSTARIARQPPAVVDQFLLEHSSPFVNGGRAVKALDEVFGPRLVNDYLEAAVLGR